MREDENGERFRSISKQDFLRFPGIASFILDYPLKRIPT